MNRPENLSTNLSTIFLPSLRASGDGRKSFIFGHYFLNGISRKMVEGRKVGRNRFASILRSLTPFSTFLPSKDKKKKVGNGSTAGGIRARERDGGKSVERFSGKVSEGVK